MSDADSQTVTLKVETLKCASFACLFMINSAYDRAQEEASRKDGKPSKWVGEAKRFEAARLELQTALGVVP